MEMEEEQINCLVCNAMKTRLLTIGYPKDGKETCVLNLQCGICGNLTLVDIDGRPKRKQIPKEFVTYTKDKKYTA